MKRLRLYSLLPFVLIFAGILLAVQPFFSGRLAGMDALLHFHRLAQLERALRLGILYPRWLPDLGLGFGFPVFNYYAPLSYYLALPWRWLGLSVSASLLTSHAVALGVLALAVYLWGRDLFGATAGIVAAFAAIYTPYTLNCLHHLGTPPAIWGMAWLVLLFWMTRRAIMTRQPAQFAGITLLYGALILSHNLTGVLGTPLVLGYALLLSRFYGFRPALRVALSLIVGLGMTAFFWLPALLEQDFVQIWQLYQPLFLRYHVHFSTLKTLLAVPRPVDPAEVNFFPPISLGWLQVALALFSMLPVGERPTAEQWLHISALIGATLIMVVLAHPISMPVWEHFHDVARFIQFPWRFLSFATLGLALLAGVGAKKLSRPGRAVVPVSVGGMMLFVLPWMFPTLPWPAQPDPTPADHIRFEIERGLLGTTSTGEYRPVWVQELPPRDMLLPLYEASAPTYIIPRLDITRLPQEVSLGEARYGLTWAEITLETPREVRLYFPWYFFPGWQAWLDGQPHHLMPDGPYGLIATDIPAGRHHLRIAFGDTPLRQQAWLISGLSGLPFVSLFVWQGWTGRRGRINVPSGSSEPIPFSVLLACTGLSVVLALLKTLYLDRYDNPFRYTRLEDHRIKGVDIPLQVNFGGKVVLMGCDLATSTVRADQPLDVALYWGVFAPTGSDYNIGLHLVDPEGRLYGQHDVMHPNNFPLSLLRPDQYVRDPHRFMPWKGTPPGRYTLQVMVYHPDKGRLDIRDKGGNPLGTTYTPLPKWKSSARPDPRPEEVLVQSIVNADLGGGIRLIGWEPLQDSVGVGQSLPLVLYWQATRTPETDHRARLRLMAEDGTVAAQMEFAPVRNDLPTSLWKSGDVFHDARVLPVPVTFYQDPSRPLLTGHYRLHLDLLDPTGIALSDGVDLGTLSVTVPERSFVLPSPTYPLQFRLDSMATLLGYDLSTLTARPGENLGLVLYWRAEDLADRSYTVFVHLMGRTGGFTPSETRNPCPAAVPLQAGYPMRCFGMSTC